MSRFSVYSATQLWREETSEPSIPTFSQNFDKMLGNSGIQLGSITELIGLPGTGKTQLCLQLCSSVQIPESLGGLDAEAIFIDTNTHFSVERFKEILTASLSKCQQLDDSFVVDEDERLDKLHYVNAFGLEKYCSILYILPKFIAEHPKVKLIVIDSIAFPFKGMDAKKRTGLLFRQMADLHQLASKHRIAVVVTNEMSTRVGLSGGAVVGALGDAWAHRCGARVLLAAPVPPAPLARTALLLKSNLTTNGTALFQITQEGIRDAD